MLRSELAAVGAAVFCRRRVSGFDGLAPDRLIRDLRRAPLRDRSGCLSWNPTMTGPRLDTLRCLSRGLLTKEIAVELGVSENTVKTRLKAVYAILGARNRAHAVSLAREKGWL